MREYSLYVINKSMRKAKKHGLLSEIEQKCSVLIGSQRNLSHEILGYKYLKKNREMNVLGYGQPSSGSNENSAAQPAIGP